MNHLDKELHLKSTVSLSVRVTKKSSSLRNVYDGPETRVGAVRNGRSCNTFYVNLVGFIIIGLVIGIDCFVFVFVLFAFLLEEVY